jgi:hypothetical protein
VLSALITFFFVKPLTHDGMIEEDAAVSKLLDELHEDSLGNFLQFRRYLEEHGYDTSNMGLLDSTTSSRVDVDEKPGSFEKV